MKIFYKSVLLFGILKIVFQVEDDNEGERRVMLTLEEKLRVLAEQVSALLHSSRSSMSLTALSNAFLQTHGYVLKPETYECNSLEELIRQLQQTVMVSYFCLIETKREILMFFFFMRNFWSVT